ncbi:MAG: M48 family metalloprotease, partial [Gemmatimonadales bacterium]
AYLNSEAELAAVLGHETGHVTARHSAAMASQQQLGSLGLLGASLWKPQVGQLLGTGATLYFLNFSRNDEKQADGLGHRYALRARYDPREMPKTFRTLQRISNTGSSRLPGFLSTHPDPGDRVRYTQAWADTVKSFAGLVVDRDRYLAHIDGIVFGEDPEQGYFDGVHYLHPVLRLRFDVPAGWQGVNQRSQVIAADPNGAAQIALSEAKDNSPDAAAQTFLAQPGVQSLATQRTMVNGEPAVDVQFHATTSDNQAVRGDVLFIQHGAGVFQFLGLALATAWPSVGGSIEQSLHSFGPTPGNQVFRQRKYLRIVTLRRPTNIADLAAQSGGAIGVPDLAILNSVADTATLAAGSVAKTVRYR